METPPLDDKARRMRDLLSSFYSPHPSMSSDSSNMSPKYTSSHDINSSSFESDHYMNVMVVITYNYFILLILIIYGLHYSKWYIISLMKVHNFNLEGLLHKHVDMVTGIKNLDTDLQMLVYENYNKFICATDSIKRCNSFLFIYFIPYEISSTNYHTFVLLHTLK
jgi:magnesium-transporting ATPase (P-type)